MLWMFGDVESVTALVGVEDLEISVVYPTDDVR